MCRPTARSEAVGAVWLQKPRLCACARDKQSLHSRSCQTRGHSSHLEMNNNTVVAQAGHVRALVRRQPGFKHRDVEQVMLGHVPAMARLPDHKEDSTWIHVCYTRTPLPTLHFSAFAASVRIFESQYLKVKNQAATVQHTQAINPKIQKAMNALSLRSRLNGLV